MGKRNFKFFKKFALNCARNREISQSSGLVGIFLAPKTGALFARRLKEVRHPPFNFFRLDKGYFHLLLNISNFLPSYNWRSPHWSSPRSRGGCAARGAHRFAMWLWSETISLSCDPISVISPWITKLIRQLRLIPVWENAVILARFQLQISIDFLQYISIFLFMPVQSDFPNPFPSPFKKGGIHILFTDTQTIKLITDPLSLIVNNTPGEKQ
jgi:hypothetical protein